jgi:HlyD family secretion protein
MRWLIRGLFASFAAAVVAVTVWALLPKPVTIDAARVVRGSFEEVVEEDGRTRVRNRYVVSSPLAGRLERTPLRAGDRVQEDDVVAVIRPVASPLLDARTTRDLSERLGAAEARLEQARATLERARATWEQSQIDHERVNKLAADGIVAANDLDRARQVSVSPRRISRQGSTPPIRPSTTSRALARRSPACGKEATNRST